MSSKLKSFIQVEINLCIKGFSLLILRKALNRKYSLWIVCDLFSIAPKDFNSYGSRRGNDAVMARGTFANIRLVNKLVGKPGPKTLHVPSGETVSYDRFNVYGLCAGCVLHVLRSNSVHQCRGGAYFQCFRLSVDSSIQLD